MQKALGSATDHPLSRRHHSELDGGTAPVPDSQTGEYPVPRLCRQTTGRCRPRPSRARKQSQGLPRRYGNRSSSAPRRPMSVAQTCRHVVETTPFIPAPRTPAFLVHHSRTCALPLPRPLTIVGRFVWTHGTFPKTPAPFHALFHLLWPAPAIPFNPPTRPTPAMRPGPLSSLSSPAHPPPPPSTEAPSPRTTKATSPPRPRPLSPDDQVPLSAGRISPSESHNGTAAPLHIRTYARHLPKTRTDLSTWVDGTLAAPCPTYPFPNQPTTDSASPASPPSALCFGLPALASWFSERRDTCTETTKQMPPGPARPLLSTCYLEP